VQQGTLFGYLGILFLCRKLEEKNCKIKRCSSYIRPRRQQQQVAFLVHAESGRRLDLPAPPLSREKGFFVFYVGSHGTPLFAACVEFCSAVPTIHIACPGDVYWSVYKHGAEPPHMLPEARRRLFVRTCIVDVALVKTHAICLEHSGQVLVFDITEMTWRGTVPCPEWNKEAAHFLVSSNGKAVLVSRLPTKENAAFRFFELDVEALEWSPMDDAELDDTSWFLRKGQSLQARDAGKRKVYTLKRSGSIGSHKQTSNGMRPQALGTSSGQEESKSITNIYAYDLDDGTVEMLIPASLVTEACHWVRPSMFATCDANGVPY
jgi:hypothetical protein